MTGIHGRKTVREKGVHKTLDFPLSITEDSHVEFR